MSKDRLNELRVLISLNSHKNNEIFRRTGRLDAALLKANDALCKEMSDIRTAEVREKKVKIDIGGLM